MRNETFSINVRSNAQCESKKTTYLIAYSGLLLMKNASSDSSQQKPFITQQIEMDASDIKNIKRGIFSKVFDDAIQVLLNYAIDDPLFHSSRKSLARISGMTLTLPKGTIAGLTVIPIPKRYSQNKAIIKKMINSNYYPQYMRCFNLIATIGYPHKALLEAIYPMAQISNSKLTVYNYHMDIAKSIRAIQSTQCLIFNTSKYATKEQPYGPYSDKYCFPPNSFPTP